MANKTPRIVGGGLGTFRKNGQAAHAAKEAQAQRDAQAKAMSAFKRSLTK